jgi:hypothetical protein
VVKEFYSVVGVKKKVEAYPLIGGGGNTRKMERRRNDDSQLIITWNRQDNDVFIRSE